MYIFMAKCISLFYAACTMFPKQNKISFLSRQGQRGSLDFQILESTMREHYPELQIRVCATEPESKNKIAFLLSMPGMIYHVATSRVCVLEGYIPAVSIPKLDSQTCVIQLWHALGAIKMFGYQSLGTEAGRTVEQAENLSMHKNYDWIIAGGSGAASAYSAAFGYDKSKIKALGMPRIDYLLNKSDQSPRLQKAKMLQGQYDFLANAANGKRLVLYAPTLRKGADCSGWMQREVNNLARAFSDHNCIILVAGHPLDQVPGGKICEQRSAIRFMHGVRSIDLLEFADCVITDYSAVAFEAALLEKPVWFYVPDIADYRMSPGLNIDPIKEFPRSSFCEAGLLAESVAEDWARGQKMRSATADFTDFVTEYFANIEEGSTLRLARFIKECYLGTFKD